MFLSWLFFEIRFGNAEFNYRLFAATVPISANYCSQFASRVDLTVFVKYFYLDYFMKLYLGTLNLSFVFSSQLFPFPRITVPNSPLELTATLLLIVFVLNIFFNWIWGRWIKVPSFRCNCSHLHLSCSSELFHVNPRKYEYEFPTFWIFWIVLYGNFVKNWGVLYFIPMF